ncbi:signal transducer and activator of transcription family protein [Heterostelium album PN500]|uniref:Signal transducer and activator of transcription n=1 Tax=Heterostelium pallidum (strain ATCC 26659 / Pp 5 / PN500) TaxID=670386 RepID=D3BJ33_HETP5|nr:signal transducer and activator of transcription family protein [Heterostelium album PN500]EFA77913.1 signal transducer and activator of transcription family protein [Heterostelium album PN500]|eukprot:XP_020430041.1 signal transducer and activator of transcription family protein [Heterostelium album PN500]
MDGSQQQSSANNLNGGNGSAGNGGDTQQHGTTQDKEWMSTSSDVMMNSFFGTGLHQPQVSNLGLSGNTFPSTLTKQDTVLNTFFNQDVEWSNNVSNQSNFFMQNSLSNAGHQQSFGSLLQSIHPNVNSSTASTTTTTTTTTTSGGNSTLGQSNPYTNVNYQFQQHQHQQQNQQQQQYNTSSSSPMNTTNDDDEIVATPPTPTIIDHDSSMQQQQHQLNNPPPLVYQPSFGRSASALNDPLSNLIQNDLGDAHHPTPNGEPNEYEPPTKLARTATLQLQGMPATSTANYSDPYEEQISKVANLNVHLSFLRSQTEKLEDDVEKMRQSSSQNLSQSSFLGGLNKYAGTNTEKISQEFYNNLINRYHERNERFLKAKEQQVTVITTHDIVLANELHGVYTTMKKEIDEEKAELQNLLSKTILQPPDLHQIRKTIEGLQSHYRIVDVLYNELQYVLNKKKPESCCAIILLQQPPSQVIFRGGKGIADPYNIELVTGVMMPDSISTVTAQIDKSESATKKEKSAATPSLENNECSLDKLKATFTNLKVNISTRMNPSHLKFTATVKDKGNKASKSIESVQTNPIVVITNESQWSEAAGKLLVGEIFEDRSEVPWELFANILHSHVFTTTGQIPNEPKRKLHTWEWDYIQQNHFGSKASLTKTECKEFWAKFGPILQTIHFKRHISSLWFEGLICGFISKNECNSSLYPAEEGSFLIRFSDSLPGSFAVAYVTNDENERVKHYLVRPEEIGPNKTLPDFLRERYQFKTLYKLDPPNKLMKPVPKDEAFKDFYSKRITKVGNPGYVSEDSSNKHYSHFKLLYSTSTTCLIIRILKIRN